MFSSGRDPASAWSFLGWADLLCRCLFHPCIRWPGHVLIGIELNRPVFHPVSGCWQSNMSSSYGPCLPWLGAWPLLGRPPAPGVFRWLRWVIYHVQGISPGSIILLKEGNRIRVIALISLVKFTAGADPKVSTFISYVFSMSSPRTAFFIALNVASFSSIYTNGTSFFSEVV